MDTSEIYIKQCERAEEIQNNHHWEDGDYTQDGIYINHYWDEFGWDIYGVTSFDTVYIWLPRQDQLQGMVWTAYINGGVARVFETKECLDDFVDFVDDAGYVEYFSMEQLWLAFVMHENYHKVWSTDNQDWGDEV